MPYVRLILRGDNPNAFAYLRFAFHEDARAVLDMLAQHREEPLLKLATADGPVLVDPREVALAQIVEQI